MRLLEGLAKDEEEEEEEGRRERRRKRRVILRGADTTPPMSKCGRTKKLRRARSGKRGEIIAAKAVAGGGVERVPLPLYPPTNPLTFHAKQSDRHQQR